MRNYETYQPKNKWEQDVLKYYQFQDDFGDPGDVCMKDRLVVARTSHICTHCGEKIVPGENYRYEAYKFDGSLRTYHTCTACCNAMAKSWTDGGKAIEKRVARHY